jgi:hypothetical protein
MLKLPTHSGFHDLFLNYLYQYKLFYYEFDWLWNSCNTKDIIEGCTTASDKLLMVYFYNSINYFSIGTKIYVSATSREWNFTSNDIDTIEVIHIKYINIILQIHIIVLDAKTETETEI